MASLYASATHRPITPVGAWSARGGIGGVFDIAEDRAVVYKEIDPAFRTSGRRRKVERLIGIARGLPANSPLKDTVTWPLEAISCDGSWSGFTMRKVPSARSLEDLCADEGISSSMRMLLGLQMGEIVRNVHLEGIVIGDLSLKNWLYDSTSRQLVLIDPDSFQVSSQDEVFATNESLELSFEMAKYGKNRALTSRSDDFLYAVALHRLLFLAHPLDEASVDSFARGASIRKNIEQRRYPYLRIQRPLPLDAFGSALEELFVRTFTGNADNIPSTTDYLIALRDVLFAQGFETCLSCGFDFPRTASRCPACNKRAAKPRARERARSLAARSARRGLRVVEQHAAHLAQKAHVKGEDMTRRVQSTMVKARKSKLVKAGIPLVLASAFLLLNPEIAGALAQGASGIFWHVLDEAASVAGGVLSTAGSFLGSVLGDAAQAVDALIDGLASQAGAALDGGNAEGAEAGATANAAASALLGRSLPPS